MRRMSAILAAALAMLAVEATAAPIPQGRGQQTIDLGGTKMDVHTYRPNKCAKPSLLLVFHGVDRNPNDYRDRVRALARVKCMIVVAPLFDKARFPGWRYQYGGIVKAKTVQDSAQWTGNLVLRLVDWARKTERRKMSYYLIGHSAGAQFLSRLAAFVPTHARRIVIANPSTHVFPTLRVDAPFGMGGVYDKDDESAQIQRYLAQPVTIFLGKGDTGDENLDESEAARAQGKTRLERGLKVYRAAKRLAKRREWTFNWRLVVLAGTGHSSRKMFASQKAIAALRP
jgi:pimeloyl-ACP methyl ester carboxylesterase